MASAVETTNVSPKADVPNVVSGSVVPPLVAKNQTRALPAFNRSASPKGAQNGSNPNKPKSTTSAGSASPKSSSAPPMRPTVITLKQVNALLAHQQQCKQQGSAVPAVKSATSAATTRGSVVPGTPERQMMRMGGRGMGLTSPMTPVAPPVPLSPSFIVPKSPPPVAVVRYARETA